MKAYNHHIALWNIQGRIPKTHNTKLNNSEVLYTLTACYKGVIDVNHTTASWIYCLLFQCSGGFHRPWPHPLITLSYLLVWVWPIPSWQASLVWTEQFLAAGEGSLSDTGFLERRRRKRRRLPCNVSRPRPHLHLSSTSSTNATRTLPSRSHEILATTQNNTTGTTRL